jgi:2-oxoglutarate/2-oxoacid ferredoxin oxidoreductase subunit beta
MSSVCVEAFHNKQEAAWCPGCGNFAILETVKQTLADMDLAPHEVVICAGVGQAPKLPHYMKVNTFTGLHGREVASATAIKLAASDLKVLVHAGDGGAYGEGGNHLLAAIRRNIDITLVVHDNHYYGLTKGQASPTTVQGVKVSASPFGVAAPPLNPLALAISQHAGFVAQAAATHKENLQQVLRAAIEHRGFSLVNTLQPCVTYDKVFTQQYYQEHCFELGEDYDPTDWHAALSLVAREDRMERIPVGVIFRHDRPAYEEVVLRHVDRPLRDYGVEPRRIEAIMERFK